MKQNSNRYYLVINKGLIFCLTLVLALTFLSLCPALFAEESNDKWQISPEVVAKAIPSHKLTLKQLIAEAEKNIRKVDGKIKNEEAFSGNQDRERVARQHYDLGNSLYKQGKIAEAKKEWQEALRITRDLEMKGYIREVERRSKEEEWESEKRIAAEQAAFKRMDARKDYQGKLKQKAKEQKAKAQKPPVQKAQTQKASVEKTQPQKPPVQKAQPQKSKEEQIKKAAAVPVTAEDKRRAVLERKAKELRQKQKLAQFKNKQKEKARLEAQKKRQDKLARKAELVKKKEEDKRQKAIQQELARQAKKSKK